MPTPIPPLLSDACIAAAGRLEPYPVMGATSRWVKARGIAANVMGTTRNVFICSPLVDFWVQGVYRDLTKSCLRLRHCLNSMGERASKKSCLFPKCIGTLHV